MITDKPSRIGYLQQLIDCVQPSVAVDPRKIAAGASTAPRSFRGLSRKALRVRVFACAGMEPERTNALLQALYDAASMAALQKEGFGNLGDSDGAPSPGRLSL